MIRKICSFVAYNVREYFLYFRAVTIIHRNKLIIIPLNRIYQANHINSIHRIMLIMWHIKRHHKKIAVRVRVQRHWNMALPLAALVWERMHSQKYSMTIIQILIKSQANTLATHSNELQIWTYKFERRINNLKTEKSL